MSDINARLDQLQHAVLTLAEQVGEIPARLDDLELQISDLDSRTDLAEDNITTAFNNTETLSSNIRHLANV